MNVVWDKDAPARKFAEDYRLPYPVGRDSGGAIGGAYGVDATPTSFFIDRNGVVVERVDGEFPGDAMDEFSHRIEKLLAP